MILTKRPLGILTVGLVLSGCASILGGEDLPVVDDGGAGPDSTSSDGNTGNTDSSAGGDGSEQEDGSLQGDASDRDASQQGEAAPPCTTTSCPDGCCTTAGACVTYAAQTPSACGQGGARCTTCSNGLCDTTDGTCSCNARTCASGCCGAALDGGAPVVDAGVSPSNETCETPSPTACGTGGAQCVSCPGPSADGTATCSSSGQCGFTCSPSYTTCGNTCVDEQNDPKNCGGCGHACTGTATCGGGCCSGSEAFAATGAIVQFVVPSCVTLITIDAYGAQGGTTDGGKGARIKGDFVVTPGETLDVAVGMQGVADNCGGTNQSGGGGGGSFVWNPSSTTAPLVAAGGGGGGNPSWTTGPTNCWLGIDAVVTENGTAGNDSESAAGGTNGSGGFGDAPSGTGSGGAGWLSAGQSSTFADSGGSTGGFTLPTLAGGAGPSSTSSSYGPGGQGGFGGGGGAVCGCGGGGGYSGGGAGEGDTCRAGGGGGGSYNGGTNQTNTPGAQTGNGQVTISWL